MIEIIQRPSWQTKKALIVEIQGALIRSRTGKRYTVGPGDIEFVGGIQKKIWGYRLNGYVIFGITNDPTVAFGEKTEDMFQMEQQEMMRGFGGNNPFHNMGVCCHHENGSVPPYNHRSLSKLPHTGILAEFEKTSMNYAIIIDWDHSLFVGKSDEAKTCAKNAGIRFRHIDDFVFKSTEQGDGTANKE